MSLFSAPMNARSDQTCVGVEPGSMQWNEFIAGEDITFSTQLTAIDKSAEKKQWWITGKIGTAAGSGYQQLFLFKIPYDQENTIIDQTFHKGMKDFQYVYIKSRQQNENSPMVVETYYPIGDVRVKLDPTNKQVQVHFVCEIDDKQLGRRRITGRYDWPGQSTEASTPAVFQWTEAGHKYRSESALLIRDMGPEGLAWILAGTYSRLTSPEYRTWEIYIYSDDENAPITEKIFMHNDGKSNFHYSPVGSEGFGYVYEGYYKVTLTLSHNPLSCRATFKNAVPTIVDMVDGKFSLIPRTP